MVKSGKHAALIISMSVACISPAAGAKSTGQPEARNFPGQPGNNIFGPEARNYYYWRSLR